MSESTKISYLPLKPVWIRAGKREDQMARDLKLKAFAYDGNITVDEDDLLAVFGERVRISLGWNPNTNAMRGFADFTTPLDAEDLKVLAKLAESYKRRRREHRGPLKAPVKRSN
jgi:hypothetical protein